MIQVELIDMEDQHKSIPCLNQVFRPQTMPVRQEGQGDCTICIADEKNKQCSAYYPVQVTIHKYKVQE